LPRLQAVLSKTTLKQSGSWGTALCERCYLPPGKPCNTTGSLSGWIRCDRRFPRVCPFSGSTRRTRPIMVIGGWRRIPLQRRAFTRDRVVRFSRLLGKFDTTASGTSAQVGGQPTVTNRSNRDGAKPNQNRMPADAQNAASRRSGALRFRAGHWPPSKLWPVVDSTVPITDAPGRPSLCSGPLIGGCSYRVSASLWAGRSDRPAAGTSLAPVK
jgi:hypothetical protein